MPCNYPTKKGGLCKNNPKDGGRCHLHKGKVTPSSSSVRSPARLNSPGAPTKPQLLEFERDKTNLIAICEKLGKWDLFVKSAFPNIRTQLYRKLHCLDLTLEEIKNIQSEFRNAIGSGEIFQEEYDKLFGEWSKKYGEPYVPGSRTKFAGKR